jgi:hemoglobin
MMVHFIQGLFNLQGTCMSFSQTTPQPVRRASIGWQRGQEREIEGRGRPVFCSLVLVCAVFILAGCARTVPAPGGKSLYDRLGGKAAMTVIVDRFLANVAADSRINGHFATADFPKLKKNLADQLCMISGGPCTYQGADMKIAHAGRHITSRDFEALADNLLTALAKSKVPLYERSELLGLLRLMKKDIVE